MTDSTNDPVDENEVPDSAASTDETEKDAQAATASGAESPPSETLEPDADDGSHGFRPLNVWPAILLIVAIFIVRAIPNMAMFAEDGPANLWMFSAFGPVICSLLILVWWVFFSRATTREKVVGLVGIIVGAIVATVLTHRSMKGPPVIVMLLPLGIGLFAAATVYFRNRLSMRRTVLSLIIGLLGFGFCDLLRNHGMWGNFGIELDWRWAESSEDRVAERSSSIDPAQLTADFEKSLAAPEWPSFRGPRRDGIYHGPKIATDWKRKPPVELWRIDVGPGWSSFAVAGKFLFTAEQRKEKETVVCYAADTGEEIWTHEIESRFMDALGGDGPRATPTVDGDSVYFLGASGHMVRLDAATGQQKWSVDLREIAERKPPMWGFCATPLVEGKVVVVYAGGADDKGTIAFDKETGETAWSVPAGDHSYGSPQVAEIAGARSITMLTNTGLDVINPSSGEMRFRYEWKADGYRSLQPAFVDGDRVVLPTGQGVGTQCIRLSGEGDELTAEELWTTLRLKPDFNDIVVHENAVYGFDGEVFTCIDLETGDRNWKRGRYGKGQVLLLADQDLLMVITETGEIVLLETNPEKHTEVTRFNAIAGKTWNHPVVIGDRLYLRNSAEAAAFQLTVQ